jgi:hypothetical protein
MREDTGTSSWVFDATSFGSANADFNPLGVGPEEDREPSEAFEALDREVKRKAKIID